MEEYLNETEAAEDRSVLLAKLMMVNGFGLDEISGLMGNVYGMKSDGEVTKVKRFFLVEKFLDFSHFLLIDTDDLD